MLPGILLRYNWNTRLPPNLWADCACACAVLVGSVLRLGKLNFISPGKFERLKNRKGLHVILR